MARTRLALPPSDIDIKAGSWAERLKLVVISSVIFILMDSIMVSTP